ncbi:MAG: tetratricopeptide repeat protein [Planctomycetes bacterium]|nr:tetratricopeptide repeat protein [Planctomycetota bacterium]
MSDRTIKLPEFKSAEHFKAWWNSPEVAQLRDQLADHPGVKPWLSQLKSVETPPLMAGDEVALKPFGKYNLARKLGQGGMGAVYLAYDTVLNRQVAVKIVVLEDEESIQRFMREARATAKLKHPNIITVYDFGVFEKYYYLTMDYIEGPSLDGLLKDKDNHLTPRRTAEMFYQIALAVDYAHQEGIIHRDIKPSNILIDRNGNTYLTDFGLAKELSSAKVGHSLTLSGTILGTPSYMSPEQAKGDKARIGPRSDIFSLGATLYHALTGQTPFKTGEIYEILDSVVNADPTPPRKVLASINQDLETICIKCLEKEPANRYQTAGELANDLRHYLDGEAISATPLGLATKAWRRVKKNKMVSISVLTAVVVLLAVTIGLIIFSIQRQQEIELYRREAQSEFEAEHYNDALEWANKAIVLDPSDVEMEILGEQCDKKIKAQSDGLTRSKQDAEKEAQDIKRQAEIRAQARAVLDRKAAASNPDETIRIAQEALRIDPTFGEAYQAIGYVYKDKGDYKGAAEYFTRAIEATPTLAYSYYERGWLFVYADSEKAISDFEKVVEYDPQSHIAYIAKGMVMDIQEKYDEAIANYTRAIEICPDDFRAYYRRGTDYQIKKQHKQALPDYARAAELEPDRWDIYSGLGWVYYKLEECDNALVALNKAIELNPGADVAYSNLGYVYSQKNEPLKALADFNRAIELNPTDFRNYVGRGVAFFDADFNKAIEIKPSEGYYYCARGDAYSSKMQYAQAMTDYNRAIELNPELAEAYSGRGSVYGKTGNYKRALAEYQRALELDPKNIEVYDKRVWLYSHRGEHQNAIADYTKIIELEPNTFWAYYQRGEAYRSIKNYRPAIADYTKVIQLAPDQWALYTRGMDLSTVYLNRGIVYYQLDEYDQALSDYNQAIKLRPDDERAYISRGIIYYAKKDYERAISNYSQAITLNPKDADAYFYRAGVYAEQGEIDRAIKDYSKAIALEPTRPNVYHNRALLYARQNDIKSAIADAETALKLEPDSALAAQLKTNLANWKRNSSK